MALNSLNTVTVQLVASRDALDTLCQSFNALPNNPASLYLSTTSRSLIIYVAPTRAINVVSLPYLVQALHRKETSASAFKSLLETGAEIKVFFDARNSAKILFDNCQIRLSVPPCTEQSYIHEVQMMELALRRSDYDREWLAGLDQCIARDSNLEVNMLIPDGSGGNEEFDGRILHLPVLWENYHNQLIANHNGVGGSFWVAKVREATRKRLGVSCGETHRGYSVNGARSAWDKEGIEEETESWNDDVMMDCTTNGEFLGGAAHWAQFNML